MKVTIIIPNYNGKHFLAPCLDSLSKQSCPDFKVLIVDNASTDGSLEYLQENYPDIEVISLKENIGFSGAVNAGIKAADTPYVILLNNDTVSDEHYVEQMIKAMESSPRYFSVSSKMIQMYRPELIDSAGDLYTVLGLGVCQGKDYPITHYNKFSSVFSACAGAAIYRRDVFEEIGYFDESFFAYLEDMDIGYRAMIYGYQNMYCPQAVVYHVGSGTSGSMYNTFKVKLSARNSIWLNYKNMPLLQLIVNLLPLLAGCLINLIFLGRLGFGKDYLSGLWDGIKGIKKHAKVKFRFSHLGNYFKIEFQLVKNAFYYAFFMLARRFERNK